MAGNKRSAVEYGCAAGFHKPFGRGGGSADSYRLGFVEPCVVYVGRLLYHVCPGVYVAACRKEHASVRAFPAAYEQYYVVACGKGAYGGKPVGYLAA